MAEDNLAPVETASPAPSGLLDAHKAKQVVLEHSGASACEVVISERFGQPFRVAYIVVKGRYKASDELLDETQLDGIFPVNTIPLTDSGEVDRAQLAALLPPCSGFLEQIKEALIAKEEVAEATAIVVPNPVSLPRFHSKTLAPINGVAESPVEQPATSAEVRLEQGAELSQALVEMPPLAEQESLPKTLAESLYHAAEHYLGEKFIYLDDKYIADENALSKQSFGDLLGLARRIRSGLQSQGLQKGDHAIVHLALPEEILPAFWGCVLAGAVPVITPVPPVYKDDASEVAKLRGVWDLLDQPLMVVSQNMQKGLNKTATFPELADGSGLAMYESLAASNGEECDGSNDVVCEPDDVAFICLSSGSTGVPKCIQMTHRNVLARGRATDQLCGNSTEDVILNWLPFDHIGSISDWHIRCIDLGCTMVYCNKELVLPDPLVWLNLMDSFRVSHTWAPNFAYASVNDALSKHKFGHTWDLSCIKTFLTAAESVSPDTVNEFLTRLGAYGLEKTAVRPAFGMAEMGSGVTYALPADGYATKAITVDRESLVGRLREVEVGDANSVSFTCLGPLIAGMSMRVVDERQRVLPEATVGNLHMKGVALSPGYYRNDKANKVFLGEGWMDTGDKGFIINGELYLSGRTKDTIILNGANYIPIEIEKVTETVPGVEVSFAAATGVKPAGDASESLAIFFSPTAEAKANINPTLLNIREQIAQTIGITPGYIVPLPKEKIPKTAIGKIQRSKLVAQLEQGDFDKQIQEIDLLLETERTLPDWFAERRWVRCQRRDDRRRQDVSAIFLVHPGTTQRLAENLMAQGAFTPAAVIVHADEAEAALGGEDGAAITADLRCPETMERAFAMAGFSKTLGSLDVIDLRPLETAPSLLERDIELAGFVDTHYPGVQALSACLQSYDAMDNVRVGVVTTSLAGRDPFVPGAGDALSAQNVNALNAATLPSLYRSAMEGLPGLQVLCVELDVKNVSEGTGSDSTAEALAQELAVDSGEAEVRLAEDGRRWVSRFTGVDNLRRAAEGRGLEPKAICVLTGGLGGVGYEVASWLLRSFSARLIIVGRSAIQGDSERSQQRKMLLDELKGLAEKNAGEVHYIACDIADTVSLNTEVSGLEAALNGKTAAFFHLAGVVREQPFVSESVDAVCEVLSPKVLGALSIDTLAAQRPGAVVVNFSSTLASIPSPLAPVYSAANRFLDLLSTVQRRRDIRSYSIAWSAWNGLGMNNAGVSDAAMQAQGLYAISPAHGMLSLAALLARPPMNALVGVMRTSPLLEASVSHTVQLKSKMLGVYVAEEVVSGAAPANNVAPITEVVLGDDTVETSAVGLLPKTETGDIDEKALLAEITGGDGEFVEAEAGTETLLLDTWKKVLNSDGFGVTDNFFALGGHSLMAAELVNLINKTCQTDFPLSVVFEAPTVREQSELINQGGYSESAQVIPLQPEGDKTPVFCLCGIDLYSQLAMHLGPNIPVYGTYLPVEGKLLDENNTEELCVRAMASEYIEAIKTRQPEGPYRLAGVSFGSVLAYEASQQLRAQGEDVDFLLLIDFVHKQQGKRASLFSAEGFRSHMEFAIRDVKDVVKRVLNVTPMFKGKYNVKKGLDVRQAAYREAWKKYEPSMPNWESADSVVVIRARDVPQERGYSHKVTCGWEQYMNAEPESHMITGDHLGVLRTPNVEVMADILKGRLSG